MKKHWLIGIVSFCLALLAGCANQPLYQNQAKTNLLDETWMSQVNINPTLWTRYADSWYFTGEPNQTEQYALKAPTSKAMTIMAVRVPQFTNIQINGNFQVQIIGRQEQNSVFILGPNAEARQVAVSIRKNTLFISTPKDIDPNCLSRVIVRIGINNLRHLSIAGYANITGRDITSDCLSIASAGTGNTLLSGNMRIEQIKQFGTGCISILGVYTPNLSMNVQGPGTVNLSGRIGIQNIVHNGDGAVRIVGADTNSLMIDACGNGLTTVSGYANLKRVSAQNNSRVYLYWVKSFNTYVYERNNARVGLAGTTTNLHVDAADAAQFAGKYLHGCNVYARTQDQAHANISAQDSLFAAAHDNSSIYYFGSPNNVSSFTKGQGVILAVWSDQKNLPIPRI